MKVLFCHPQIKADHPWVKALQAKGHAVLVAASPDEAIKIARAHAQSLDLMISHREDASGKGDSGFKVLSEIKKIEGLADFPWIGTSSTLNEKSFAEHQETPNGANAYLKAPFTDAQLTPLVDTVMGLSDSGGGTSTGFVLEDSPFAQSEATTATQATGGTFSIHLDLPNLDDFDETAIQAAEDAATLDAVNTASESPFNPSEPIELSKFIEPIVQSTDTASSPEEVSLSGIPAETPIEAAATIESTETSEPTEFELAAPDDMEGDFEIEGLKDLEGQSAPQELNWESEESIAPLETFSASTPAAETVATPAVTPSPVHTAQSVVEASPQSTASSAVIEVAAPLDSQITQIVQSFEAGQGLESPKNMFDPTSSFEIAPQPPVNAEVIDAQAESAMSYLFQKPPGRDERRPVEIASISAETAFAQPVGDAVVPGGAANTPDLETLKQYLLLREQDVGVLSSQLRSAKLQIQNLEKLLELEKGKNTEISFERSELDKKLEGFNKTKEQELEALRSEMSDLKFQIRVRSDKMRGIETQMRDSSDELDRIRERVKSDIRKIRVREKELENRLEIMKKDSEALIMARENKIIELKRKIDLLEFNLDLLQDRHAQEKQRSAVLKERLGKAAQIVRAAGGLLDHSELATPLEEPKQKAS